MKDSGNLDGASAEPIDENEGQAGKDQLPRSGPAPSSAQMGMDFERAGRLVDGKRDAPCLGWPEALFGIVADFG